MDKVTKNPIETYIDVFEYLRSGGVKNYEYEKWKELMINVQSIPSPIARQPVYLELVCNSPYVERDGEYNDDMTKNLEIAEFSDDYIEMLKSHGYDVKNLEFTYKRKHIADPVQYVTHIVGFQALRPSFMNKEFTRDLTKAVGENLEKLTEIADYLGYEKDYVRKTFVVEDHSSQS